METTQQIIDKLKENGWRASKPVPDNYQFYSCKTLYYKPFPGHEKCQCNYDKPKQVEIIHSVAQYREQMHESFEVECVGELKSGSWLKLQSYAIDKPTYELLMEKVDELLKVWDFAAK